MSTTPGVGLALLAAAIGVAGVVIGLWLTGARRRARIVVPFSAGILLAVVLFGLLPELIGESGWPPTLLTFGAGYAFLLLINRYVVPVCPTCAHDHDHVACESRLHGFAPPLIAACALHSFLDGWSIAATQMASPLAVRVAVPLAIVLHKIPEGLALGAMLRAAVRSRSAVFAWGALAELTTLAGGVLAVMIAPSLGSAWITYPLGIAAGWLSYLGAHALHQEWKRRTAASAAAVQQGAQS